VNDVFSAKATCVLATLASARCAGLPPRPSNVSILPARILREVRNRIAAKWYPSLAIAFVDVFRSATVEPLRVTAMATQLSGPPYMPADIASAHASNPFAEYDTTKLKSFLAAYRITRDPGSLDK